MNGKETIPKTATVGIFGQKGTGKTYLTRQFIEATPKDAIVFDTIGALSDKGKRLKNVKIYEIDVKEIDKQVIAFSQIVLRTHHNMGVNLNHLTKDEIVAFTEAFLRITPFKDKYVFIDEMADYTPQIGESSKELERLVRHGRNAGDTFFFNTQRPAYLTKNVIALVDVAIFFRLVWERDIVVVKDVLNNLGKKRITEEIHAITNLKTGERVIYKF